MGDFDNGIDIEEPETGPMSFLDFEEKMIHLNLEFWVCLG